MTTLPPTGCSCGCPDCPDLCLCAERAERQPAEPEPEVKLRHYPGCEWICGTQPKEPPR